METTVAQRIKSILNGNQISIAAFAKMIGMLQVTCNRQIRGDQAVSLAMIEGFLHVFPDISAEWLLRGEGEMCKSNSGSAQVEAAITPSQDESIWKAKYEAIKECYDTLASNIGGLSKRNVNVG
jgi:hypothetical protein